MPSRTVRSCGQIVGAITSPTANEGREDFIVVNESLHRVKLWICCSCWWWWFLGLSLSCLVSKITHRRWNDFRSSIPLAWRTSVVGFLLGSLSFKALGSFLLPTEGATAASAPTPWPWAPCLSRAATGFLPLFFSQSLCSGNWVRSPIAWSSALLFLLYILATALTETMAGASELETDLLLRCSLCPSS